jgi:hypothetical protein
LQHSHARIRIVPLALLAAGISVAVFGRDLAADTASTAEGVAPAS